ncbi:MAG: putative lipid II flippase FtsW [Akkermansiaceae bacterium]|nr:putative lipid II flippase FtsW [Verrucomicrobiales bacterium]
MKLAVTTLVFCVAALLALGMVMLYSSSMTQVGAHYLIKQLIWGALGIVACLVATTIDYRILKKFAPLIFGVAIVLLVLVLIPQIGEHEIGYKTKGARRWFNFGGIRFQPSELAKLAMIIAVAAYGDHFQRKMPTLKRGIVIPGIFISAMLLLIIREPDFGCTMLLATVAGTMLVLAGARWRYILPPVLIAATVLAFVIWKDPMRSQRVYSWMHLEETKSDKGHQAYQAMLALGSGGWTGLGLGNGRQKLGFIPEHHTDFILSIIGEELGLVATLLVVAGFLAVVLCGLYIAYRARDAFGLLLASGLTLLIGLQAVINIGVVTGALPNKGLPLPFISYGGSNLLAMLTCVGLLLSVARRARVTEDYADAPIASGEVQTA